jgi:hypothetical protein
LSCNYIRSSGCFLRSLVFNKGEQRPIVAKAWSLQGRLMKKTSDSIVKLELSKIIASSPQSSQREKQSYDVIEEGASPSAVLP